MAGHSTKQGDTPTLRWTLGRDITGAAARVIIARHGQTPIVDRAGTIDDPTTGIVSIVLTAAETAVAGSYSVEIETTVGATVLTHPDDGYETLSVVADLDP